jgi:hypothetical protein
MQPRRLDANEQIRSAVSNRSSKACGSALALFSFLCFPLFGCDSQVTRTDITDVSGNNRLVQIDRKVGSVTDWLRNRHGYDFDSLVWRTNAGGNWYNRLTISKRDFQGTNSHTRWVSEIHSIDPTNGTAVIKVAEGDAPEGSSRVHYIYSWREWSLLTNAEVRVIRICTVPSENFD